MKVLILNSGMGSRMGDLTKTQPKCMSQIYDNESIISHQLKLLYNNGINDIVITTGLFDQVLVDYCKSLNLDMNFTFVNNNLFAKTNYIYSIYLARDFLHDDIIMMHGDLVFEDIVLKNVLKCNVSCMTVSTTQSIPQKDFKAVISNGFIKKVGIEFFDNAVKAQPLYKINKIDWEIWLEKIVNYCENRQVLCYAENAFNEVSDRCKIRPMDFKDFLCEEIDTIKDLINVRKRVQLH